MLAGLSCDPKSSDPEDVGRGTLTAMVARIRREKRIKSFILVFGF
jgi:hypothetical protein